MKIKIILIVVLLLLSGILKAQIPDVPAAFPNNVCTPGQLLYRQAGMGRITNIAYHNGHIYTNNVGGSDTREFLFANSTSASSLFGKT